MRLGGGADIGSAGGPSELGWLNPTTRGIMGVNCSLRSADITDGQGNTILLGEIRAGASSADCRGVWAMGGAGPSALFGVGSGSGGNFTTPSDYGPNYQASSTSQGDNILNGSAASSFGTANSMPCVANGTTNIQQTIRSLHRAGAHICLADGSVRWISDSIGTSPQGGGTMATYGANTTAASTDCYSVWDRLIASGDGEPISAEQFAPN